MKRFASGMSWSMVSFRAAMPTREIADRRTITENPRPPIHRMAEAICAKRTTSSRTSAMPAAIHDQQMNSSTFSRSEEHTSELQSRLHLVCRLLLEKKKKRNLVDMKQP